MQFEKGAALLHMQRKGNGMRCFRKSTTNGSAFLRSAAPPKYFKLQALPGMGLIIDWVVDERRPGF
jgi:hypothetical protein